ncbi:TetR family transcriptional regulator [Massilia dura]|uniref:TetR family transcriptional regulator n=1 Tax=Pseudoduganella dura TaxID=321982 RepID=A0A6I3XSC7_9BURK|nr:TetR family transcriptional regulator [Pseudoduganella dura]MUI15368.1 TetR family transcriptional regulator [Pseudoduganella dura]GGX80457.1 TetR family transcriptional regulator [Pseudoduganella dura]
MRVSKAQAQENRARVVETASALFRERGYDDVGVAELMAAAGLTHGGFYNQFESKAALMSEATACSLSRSNMRMADVDVRRFIEHYLSREHRDSRGDGCTIAALSGDAARQDDGIKNLFEAGIAGLAKDLGDKLGADNLPDTRAKVLSMVAHLVGAVMLSRACTDDAPIADEILKACRADLLAQLSGTISK